MAPELTARYPRAPEVPTPKLLPQVGKLLKEYTGAYPF